MRSSLLAFATTIGLIAMSAPASAAVISGSYGFSASPVGATETPPVFFGPFAGNPATGAIDITFDNSADIVESTTGVSARGLNFAVGSGLSFTYVRLLDLLTIGGSPGTSAVALPGSDDFALVISDASSNPVGQVFALSQVSPAFFGLGDVRVTFTPAAVAVPEPAALALFGLGLAGLLLSRAGRRA